jgi:hypothetical protein
VARICATAAALVVLAAPAPAPAKLLVKTKVDPNARGRKVPRSFLGFSVEWNTILGLTGFNGSGGPNTVYEQFMQNLAQFGGGMPTLRVGGGFQDSAWWNPDGAPFDYRGGIFVDITPDMLTRLAELESRTNQRLTLGVNLAANDPTLAANEARAFAQYIPRKYIAGLEVGNEPDFYDIRVKYEVKKGKKVVFKSFTRPRSYNGKRYLKEWDRITGAVRRAAPRLKLVGTGGYGLIVKPATFVKRERRHLAYYSEHAYPLSGCNSKGHAYTRHEKQYPTLLKLLGDQGSIGNRHQQLIGVKAAHRYHKRYVITETNSVSCKTRTQVSASLGTAMWALDQMMLETSIGVDGINYHLAGLDKSPFAFLPFGNGRWEGRALPVYWAMLAYARTVGSHGKLLYSPTYLAKTGFNGLANARVWAVRDGRHLNILVINKNVSFSGTAQIALRSRKAGKLMLLTGPNVTSGKRLSFGGQTISDTTETGQLEGPLVPKIVRPVRGVYKFKVPRMSAALLQID